MSGDLTTLEALKRYLGREGSDEAGQTSDELLKQLISAASGQITRFASREFVASEDGEERAFAHDGGRFLDLAPYDLRSVDTITVTRDGSSTVLEAGQFGLRPLPAPDGVHQWIQLADDPGESEITIKGAWGFEQVPADVANWTHLTVAEWLRGGVYAYTQDLEAAALYSSRSLPRIVETGIEDTYRQPVVT
ncbi:MAG TPA: hypothetical protein VFN92_13435 [Solirubrobacterales bacterium]|nr:hypothetical protein [Solirubrobacterales bacterium]